MQVVPRVREANLLRLTPICYCSKTRRIGEAELMCLSCKRWVHHQCLDMKMELPKEVSFYCDYTFTCKTCSGGQEKLVVNPSSYNRMAVCVMANLKFAHIRGGGGDFKFDFVADVVRVMDTWWNLLTTTAKPTEYFGDELRLSLMCHPTLFKFGLRENRLVVELLFDELYLIYPYNPRFTVLDRFASQDFKYFQNALKSPMFNFRSSSEKNMIFSHSDTEDEVLVRTGCYTLEKIRWSTGCNYGLLYFEVELISSCPDAVIAIGFRHSDDNIGNNDNDDSIPFPYLWVHNQFYLCSSISNDCNSTERLNRIGCALYLPITKPYIGDDGKLYHTGAQVFRYFNKILCFTSDQAIRAGTWFPTLQVRGEANFRINLGPFFDAPPEIENSEFLVTPQ